MAIPASSTPAGGTLSRVDAVPTPRFPERFGTRIFLYIVTLSLGTSFTTSAIFYWRQRGFIERDRTVRANTLLANLASQAELGAYAADPALCELPARRTLAESDVTFVAVYDKHGKEILGYQRPDIVPRLPPPEVFARLDDPVDQLPATLLGPRLPDDNYDDLYAPIITLARDPAEALAGGQESRREVVGLARVGLSLKPAREQLDEMLRWGLLLGAAILVVGVLSALFISRKVSRPIAALIRGADQIRSGELETRVAIESRDELGQLAYSFNRMARRLSESITALEHQSRDLEVEVERRTAEVQRAAAFAALLNAPLGRHDAALVPDDPRAIDSPLARLLDDVLGELKGGTGARAVAVYLEPVPAEGAHNPPPGLVLERCLGAAPQLFAEPPALVALERGLPFVEGDRTVAPMLLGVEVIGCLAFVDMPLRPDLLRFVGQAALQLGVAVGNVRAYAAADELARALKERNVALAHQRDQLREMNRLKSEFLANVSHELRTPLNAIIGYCELISDGIYGDVTNEQKEALAGIDDSGKGLLALINEILDLAKVESGKMVVYLQDIDLHDVARAVVNEAAALAKDRPYKVRLLQGAPGLRVRTDAAKVKQILTNLVSNAVKFTRAGSVDVTLSALPEGGFSVSVRDTGIGIKPQDLGIIFEEFRQVDGSYTRQFGGTGLGLAIAKRFAHMLGGQITVESTVGVGSLFTLKLPPSAPEPAPSVRTPTGPRPIIRGDARLDAPTPPPRPPQPPREVKPRS